MGSVRSWPTRDGWIAALLAFVLVDLGALGGNNLILLVGSVGWAALAVDLVIGRANLRGLEVSWRLPDELFAGEGCRGAFVVRNRRRVGAARSVEIADGHASGSVEALAPGDETEVGAWWRMPRRGRFALEGVRLMSAYPFGLFTHRTSTDAEARGIVYPRPRRGDVDAAGAMDGDGDAADRHQQTGDFRELRPYRPGDRLRSIHWRTSARVGRPMVVVRGGERTRAIRVVVPGGPGLEAQLERATGAVLEATGQGLAVGLDLPDHEALGTPASGTRWRRQLLDALALYEADAP